MLKKIIFLLFFAGLLPGCKHILIDNSVTKIIIEERTHEYIGKEIDKREISDTGQIRDIIDKLNEYEKEVTKFQGTYFLLIESENGERVVLRTNGINFEVISGLEKSGIKYFKIKSRLDLLTYF
jgi:hypothetical protein